MKVRYVSHYSEFKTAFMNRIRDGLRNAAGALLSEMRVQISSPSPPVSSPGSPPGRETGGRHPGLAIDSLRIVHGASKRKPSVQIGEPKDVFYMGLHQTGKAHGGKERPWLEPSLEAAQDKMAEAFLRAGDPE